MKNKLVFRILGALSSSLIVVSVFVPYVAINNYFQSIWKANEIMGTLYLPIMIITFGVLGIIFFSINIKTELAYMSSGALSFFAITETIKAISQGSFGTLSIGYYCLVIGAFLTGLMAFLCNIKTKQPVKEIKEEVKKEESMIDQIDKLYNNQTISSNVQENDMIINVIQPLPVTQNIEPINNIPIMNAEESIQPISQPSDMSINNIPVGNGLPPITALEESPIVSSNIGITKPVINNDVNNQLNNVNPVVSEFKVPVQVQNNIPQDVNNSVQANPMMPDFPVQENAIQQSNNNTFVNPVVSEFVNVNPSSSQFTFANEQPKEEIPQIVQEEIKPLNSVNIPNIMGDSNKSDTSNLDIFG